MRYRFARAIGALACGAVTLGSFAASLEPVTDSTDGLVSPAWIPQGVADSKIVVMVKLNGNPLAVSKGNALRNLSRADRDALKAQLKGQQNSVAAKIQAMGGTVLGTYQVAYNGIKVMINRSKVNDLTGLQGVDSVHPVIPMQTDNFRGATLIGIPGVWGGLGIHGEGVKVAVIDTGIDYTHANFGGPGTKAAYTAALASDTAPADPSMFGPNAPRVKGGIDLVGDAYDAASSDPAKLIPHPDPNPLDCNGHGSHTAGTVGGSGVTAGGLTYAGSYDGSTLSNISDWLVPPGMAPKVDLYSVRVFGCTGSTNATVDGIEWAVDNDMDVINMSLGSSFGMKDDSSAEASTNAVKAGVVVVASAGNSGVNQYLVGSPSTADGAISVAASDAWASTPGATITLPSGSPITAINANGYAFSGPVTYTVKVITDNPATLDRDESLGCSVADFGGPLPANTIAVVNRGTCARVAKAIFGQQAGAAAVVMVNNDTTLPPFEGPITSNPDDGTPYTVTIPFLGVKGLPTTPTSNGGRLRAADGFVTTVSPTNIANTNYKGFASFTSAGPRSVDSALKPDITAPGVSVFSTGMGTGNSFAILSGTSMAAPHVAGVAALTRQAHASWTAEDIKAAIVATGSPSDVLAYKASRGGTGLVQPVRSTGTQVVARANGDYTGTAVNFGIQEFRNDFSKTRDISLINNGDTSATFNVSQANATSLPHAVSFSAPTVVVPAHSTAQVSVTLNVPAATAGTSNGSGLSFREIAGTVLFTPVGTDNGGIALRVPYYLVPRTQSDVSTTLSKFSGNSAVATVLNKNGAISGDADFYAWGLSSPSHAGTDRTNVTADIRAVGVQSFPFTASEQAIVFAVNTYGRWSNAATNEFDIYVDVDGDGTPDYIVVGVDQGAVQTGTFNGRMATFVFSTRSSGAAVDFFATAPTDSSTAELVIRSGRLCRAHEPCLNASNPTFTYQIVGFDLWNGGVDAVPGVAKFNAWSSAISQGGFASVAPGASAGVPISVDPVEWARSPALGLMIVTLDNKSGQDEAQLIPVTVK